ncbi:MAG: family transcriptional regulator [Devosia sp.]|uniref:helix-turn-helix domain-containing protein n=1 Tax=Devosia sp. TaxID=1871048 RepID=UPI0026364BB3|nr:helix-turn-helix transcriptional regulator [Devosia sp.]MDB5588759.1 family transcriptional regulator [Devosia sp.]
MTDMGSIGEKLHDWRRRRRLSQLDLASDADISARHLSFIETGRSKPSRPMLLKLAETLDIPLRERNAWLLAAGFAPIFPERPLDDAALRPTLDLLETLLAAHQPFPALAIDRHWTLVRANAAITPLLEGIAPFLLEPPVNVLRLSLHPQGLAPRIANLFEWKAHLLHRLARQITDTADPVLADLYEELRHYPAGTPTPAQPATAIAVPLQLRSPAGIMSFLSTTMVFGTPLDVTLSELAIETFLPADAATIEMLKRTMAPVSED